MLKYQNLDVDITFKFQRIRFVLIKLASISCIAVIFLKFKNINK